MLAFGEIDFGTAFMCSTTNRTVFSSLILPRRGISSLLGFTYQRKDMKQMKKTIIVDILQELHEKKILKADEIVRATFHYALLTERFTGKRYSYRIIDMNTFETHYLCSKSTHLTQDRLQQMKEKMKEKFGEFLVEPELFKKSNEERSLLLLSKLFSNIMPKRGFHHREVQEKLAITMLKALHKGKIALCEAGVGTGKTHAYILATVIHNLFSQEKTSTILSTSSISLQKAVTEEYIPQISALLLEERIIDQPLRFVVRKGKGHYFCLNRASSHLCGLESQGQSHTNILELNTLMETKETLDLDSEELPPFLKSKISVENCDAHCGFRHKCTYQKFLLRCRTNFYDFQIVNHNYFVADMLVKRQGSAGLLSECGQVVLDEAHKFPTTVWDMYGLSLSSKQIPNLLGELLKYRNKKLLKHEPLLHGNRNFFQELQESIEFSGDFTITKKANTHLTTLIYLLNETKKMLLQPKQGARPFPKKVLHDLDELLGVLLILEDYSQWIVTFHRKQLNISLIPKDVGELLCQDYWRKSIPTIFTSGTLSVAGNFDYFKGKIGLNNDNPKIIQFTAKSPFDYENNALLYLPKDIPFHDIGDNEYIPEVAKRVCELIKATHGHCLILFTSYRLMEQVFSFVQQKIFSFPLFITRKKEKNVLDEFRQTKNGVLFATDSMGEGIDLAGDILSSVVIVKLPFPIPTALSKHEIEQESSFQVYQENHIIPSMLTKLRQWIGRGIRTETDTCVFTILDIRASKKYNKAILTALPTMPVVTALKEVEEFITEKKGEDYFDS